MARRGRRETEARAVDYRRPANPFPVMNLYSADRIEAMHEAALDTLETLGMKILLPEARDLFRAAGARVEEEMVYLGREIVQAALATAPRSIECRAGARDRDVTLKLGNLVFQPGAGCPHATDLDRGRRPGSGRDFEETVRLTQAFDALHMVPPLVEPQDIDPALRHYFTMRTMLTRSDKLPFVYARGTPQTEDCFAMLRDFRGLDEQDFAAASHCYTIVNTNSPRQIDIPMAQGLIDFARAGQVVVVTPFTLMGAMAPITVAGAMTLSHAEALAAITLNQLARPGAPVTYGTFTSNVDMKSGAPAFGTPEHFKASLVAGQLARHLGLPWRCASGSAANLADAQAATETQFALWGCLLAGATIVIHAAGWLEGGLTIGYEKLICDMEAVNMVAELCSDHRPETHEDLALDALAEVLPGGHFFGARHTMARYQTEFYEPLVADWSNFGSWTENGARDAGQRARDVWRKILDRPAGRFADDDQIARLNAFVAAREREGGAPPVS